MPQPDHPELTLEKLRQTASRIEKYVNLTPIHRWQDPWVIDQVGDGELYLKLEFLQQTGSFKARGALNNALTRVKAEPQPRSDCGQCGQPCDCGGLRGENTWNFGQGADASESESHFV